MDKNKSPFEIGKIIAEKHHKMERLAKKLGNNYQRLTNTDDAENHCACWLDVAYSWEGGHRYHDLEVRYQTYVKRRFPETYEKAQATWLSFTQPFVKSAPSSLGKEKSIDLELINRWMFKWYEKLHCGQLSEQEYNLVVEGNVESLSCYVESL